ncbi:rapid alkalinization factor-like [Silene latifolia]|uniref:rapid alkalinization factor-like n=1 Tax=Silene latifolia TaxID=37657 RepID=UPI003D77F621
MAESKSKSLQFLAIALTITILSIISTVQAGTQFEVKVGLFGSGCRGTVGECLDAGEEFDMESDTHRRILAQTQYISYGALNKNRVPCSKRGASYYNCQPSGAANPYTRGCSAITHCARSNG